jgi:hypothetical protein
VILRVALSASSYHKTEIAAYQAVDDPARPLDGLSPAEQGRVLVQICREIEAAARP